jgi:hypothetical protein
VDDADAVLNADTHVLGAAGLTGGVDDPRPFLFLNFRRHFFLLIMGVLEFLVQGTGNG